MYVNDAILDKEIGGRLTIFWLVKVLFRIKILEREYEKKDKIIKKRQFASFFVRNIQKKLCLFCKTDMLCFLYSYYKYIYIN